MPPPPALVAAPAPSPPPASIALRPAPKALELLALGALLALGGCRSEPVAALGGCRSEPVAPIHVVLGPSASDEATFTPRAALAELIEVSPTETTLLVHLTSAERTCEALAPASAEEVAVALRLTLPAGTKLEPATFPRAPLALPGEPSPLVVTVKLRGRKQELQPGGELVLSRVEARPQGPLEGLLKLEFAGNAERAATRVSGRFLAHFCKVNRLR